MATTTITWHDRDTTRPAHDVVVRLVALTDPARDKGDICAYLMRPGPDATWVWTADLPPDLRTSYQLCPVRDRPVRGEDVDDQRWAEIIAAGVPDPACPDRLPPGCVYGNPDEAASVLSMPEACPQPWADRRPTVPHGSLVPMPLAGGSLVHVYRSLGAADHATPLVVVFDAHSLLAIDVTATWDNLVAGAVVDPLTVVLVESIRGSTPRGPSRIAGLTVASGLESFVFEELLPAVEARYPVSDRPAERVLVGHSLGAVAALHLASRRPDVFGGVVAGSPALWWPGDNGQLSGSEVAAAYAGTARVGRLFLEVGSEEGGLLKDARTFRGRLAEAGRDLNYREFRGGHDLACWRGGLADGVVDVLGTAHHVGD